MLLASSSHNRRSSKTKVEMTKTIPADVYFERHDTFPKNSTTYANVGGFHVGQGGGEKRGTSWREATSQMVCSTSTSKWRNTVSMRYSFLLVMLFFLVNDYEQEYSYSAAEVVTRGEKCNCCYAMMFIFP